VLRKMGASLAEAQAAIKLLSDERTSSTHPGKYYRLDAVSKGWNSANEQLYAKGNITKPVTKPAAKPQYDQRTTAKPQIPNPKSSLDTDHESQNVTESKFILSRVHFSKAPKEEFYLTSKLHLVHITGGKVKIIGKLIKTNDEAFPYFFESELLQPVYVSDRGELYNKRGQRIGYLS
jgi:hypothetical protein